MIAKIENITITSLETITAFSKSGNYLFTLDELQNTSIQNTAEKVPVAGKQGRLINNLKRNKAVAITGTNGLLSLGLMAADSGAEVMTKDVDILWYETLTVTGGKAKTAFKAVGTAGAEIDSLFVKDPITGVRIRMLEQDAAAAAGKFAYDPATKELTFHTDIADGTHIVVYYNRKINGQVISNNAKNYSEKCTLYIDAFGEDHCNTTYRVQIIVHTCDFNGNFNIDMGDNPSTHSFEAQALASGCTSDGSFWDFIVFGMNEQDVI